MWMRYAGSVGPVPPEPVVNARAASGVRGTAVSSLGRGTGESGEPRERERERSEELRAW